MIERHVTWMMMLVVLLHIDNSFVWHVSAIYVISAWHQQDFVCVFFFF